MPDLNGLTAVVTGANSGLGFHSALELARHGADVVMASRDATRGADALGRVRTAVPDALVSLGSLDLADLTSVRAFAASRLERGPLHILVNNAGLMAVPRGATADGFELQLGTNHLGHFALTGLLLPTLVAQPWSRVVTVSSVVAERGRINLDDLQWRRRYHRWGAYAQSKLANLLFAFELDRRADAAGTQLVSVAAHPGFAATNLQAAAPAHSGRRLQATIVRFGTSLVAQSAAQGALPQLYAATAPDVHAGDYYGPRWFHGLRGAPTLVAPPKQALDIDTARHLWSESERLTGVTFDGL